MSHSSSEKLDSARVVGLIETDMFCSKCGFNLHTQKVWRDERLDIPVCRCPECGAIDAAGRNTATSSVWLKRLALVGLLLWLSIVLAFVVATGFLIFVSQMSAPEGLLTERIETRATGEPVEQTTNNPPTYITRRPNDANPTFTADEVVMRPYLPSWMTGHAMIEPDDRYRYSRETHWTEFTAVSLLLAVPHGLCAILIGCLVWFWQRRWQWLWTLMPGVVALVSIAYYSAMHTSRSTWNTVEYDGFEMYVAVIGVVAAVQTIFMIAGLSLGRPIGRFFITVLIPPKSRQLFAFLWHCDGRTMPAARTPDES